VNNWLYLAQAHMMYGMLDEQVAVQQRRRSPADGQLKYDDQKWGYGGNFGSWWSPGPGRA